MPTGSTVASVTNNGSDSRTRVPASSAALVAVPVVDPQPATTKPNITSDTMVRTPCIVATHF